MKKLIVLFSAVIMTMLMMTAYAKYKSYGTIKLDYETSTETNSAGVADVIVIWDAEKAYADGINVVGTVTVAGQSKTFWVNGIEGKKVITFRGLRPDARYSVTWEFIEPTGFPGK